MSLISVIVPVYNVEKYLAKCLDTVLAQTFTDIEVICVNDGSTDGSRKILEEYSKKDSRIKIVDKENGGLSSARNAGMKIATGEFISFVDSDDWIDETMLEKLHQNITSLNTDIAICAVHQFDEEKQEIDDSCEYFTLGYFDESFNNKAFSYVETKPFLLDVCVMAWNKLYRKSFLDECRVEFPEGLVFEDGPFFFSIFFKTKRVSIVRDFLYYYRINRSGSILKKAGKQFFDIIDVVNLMYEHLENSEIFEDVKYEFFRQKANDINYRYELVDISLKTAFAKKFKKESCLLDENVFDFSKINKEFPIEYKKICILKSSTSILSFYLRKIEKRFMYKIMQVLYTEENIYYLKFWKLVIRLKKRANIYDIWYENDRIYVVLFGKIKFNFKFEYSKLEQN